MYTCTLLVCRKLWHLAPHTHSNYVHLLSGFHAITNLVYYRCYKLISSALCSDNYIVCHGYSVAMFNCRNFVGFNTMYGHHSIRLYSEEDISNSLLINELIAPDVVVSGFVVMS